MATRVYKFNKNNTDYVTNCFAFFSGKVEYLVTVLQLNPTQYIAC